MIIQNIKPQTVITMIGPTGSGKTFLANQIVNQAKFHGKTAVIISSNDIRNALMGSSSRLTQAESRATGKIVYDLFEASMKSHMQSPVNTEIIILDASGLDSTYRQSVAKIAKDHQYTNEAIIFDVTEVDIKKLISDEDQRNQASRQIKGLRKGVFPNFNKHDYTRVTKFNSADYEKQHSITFEEKPNVITDSILKSYLGEDLNFGTIGDVHGCIEELKELISLTNHKVYILNGDFIDKCSEEQLRETLLFLKEGVYNKKLLLIRGNHETYVYRALNDQKTVYELNDETKHFMSMFYLNDPKNSDIRAIFEDLYENHMYEYAKVVTDNTMFFISHAPTEKIHIGKHSQLSLKMMRNRRILHDGTDPVMQIKDLINENDLPYVHIFGHIETGKNMHVYKKHVCIDQGCVSGGHLTCATINIQSGSLRYNYVASKKPAVEITDFSSYESPYENLIELTDDQLHDYRKLTRSKPIFIGPTISPSPVHDMAFESPEGAISLFKKTQCQ